MPSQTTLDFHDVRKVRARFHQAGNTIWLDIYLDDMDKEAFTLFMSNAPDEAARLVDALGEPDHIIDARRRAQKAQAREANNLAATILGFPQENSNTKTF